MKQFWTPLARAFGVVDADVAKKSADQSTLQPPSRVVDASQWPELFMALRAYAQDVWCVRSQRHAEVNPSEILSIREIRIQASSSVMGQQLQDWYSESDTHHLIQWMVRGPFNTEHIRTQVNFLRLDRLVVIPYKEIKQNPGISPYLVEPDHISQTLNFDIQDVSEWEVIEPTQTLETPTVAIDVVIEDNLGQRHLQVRYPKLILGTEKMVVFPNGEEVDLKNQSEFNWQGETARFLNVNAKHVSGMHVLVSSNSTGFVIQDLHSTNGTFIENQRLSTDLFHTTNEKLSLGLGGPLSDAPKDSAKVHLTIARPKAYAATSSQTPMRTETLSNPVIEQDVIELMEMGNLPSTASSVPIEHFPFLIGRGLDCGWTVGPEHPMVSRRHLIIHAHDLTHGCLQVQDISRYGFTLLGDKTIGLEPIWISLGEPLTIGKTDGYEGYTFVFKLKNVMR